MYSCRAVRRRRCAPRRGTAARRGCRAPPRCGSAAAGPGTRARRRTAPRFARCVKSPLATMTSMGSSRARGAPPRRRAARTGGPKCRSEMCRIVSITRPSPAVAARAPGPGTAGPRAPSRPTRRRDRAPVEQAGAGDHGGVVRGQPRRGRVQLAARRRGCGASACAARGWPPRRRPAPRAAPLLLHRAHDLGVSTPPPRPGTTPPRRRAALQLAARLQLAHAREHAVFRPLNENA
jgi:hypothetical protein